MCLIFHKPAEIEFPEYAIKSSFTLNNDGFGLMHVKNGRVRTYRKMAKTSGEVFSIVQRYRDQEMAGHMRLATSGDVNKKMCHPLKILRKETDGADLYMMHNGVMNFLPTENKRGSDTWHLAELWLKPWLKREGPDLVQDEKFQFMIQRFIGGTNKLLFLDDMGRYTFINKDLGSEKLVKNCWVSNPSAVYRPTTVQHGSQKSYLPPWRQDNYSYTDYGRIWQNTNKAFYNYAEGWEFPDEPSPPHSNEIVYYGDITIEDIANFSYHDMEDFVLQQPENTVDILFDIMTLKED